MGGLLRNIASTLIGLIVGAHETLSAGLRPIIFALVWIVAGVVLVLVGLLCGLLYLLGIAAISIPAGVVLLGAEFLTSLVVPAIWAPARVVAVTSLTYAAGMGLMMVWLSFQAEPEVVI
jgi:hypothetical protein